MRILDFNFWSTIKASMGVKTKQPTRYTNGIREAFSICLELQHLTEIIVAYGKRMVFALTDDLRVLDHKGI